MEKLTFSLRFTPSIETNKNAKYTCSDNKVHIRLKDYNKPQEIKGFEDKLTYLITYIFVSMKYNSIDELMSSMYLVEIENVLRSYIKFQTDYTYKGLKILPKYSKKDKYNLYGNIDIDCFPSILENSNIHFLDYFQKVFSINLYDFIFNDQYEIIIRASDYTGENKFTKKEKRREFTESNSILYKLW